MSLTAGLWITALLVGCSLGAGVLAGIAADAWLTMRDLARSGKKYQ